MNNIYPDIKLSEGCVLLDQTDKVFDSVGLMFGTTDRNYGIVVESNNSKINKLLRKIVSSEKEDRIIVFFAPNSSSGSIRHRRKPCVIVPASGILGTMIVSRASLDKYIDDRKSEERKLIDELKSSQRIERVS